MRPLEDRIEAWSRLGDIIEPDMFEAVAADIGLNEVVDTATKLLEGKVRGRVVVTL
jgi:acrylyl-CoA reductase (NADPH)